MGASTTASGYIEEIGTSSNPIPLFPNNFSRTKFRGKYKNNDTNAITRYTCAQEPSSLYQTVIEPGTIWVHTGDGNRVLIFISKEEIDQYDYNPTIEVDNQYAIGGWMTASSHMLRSPHISYSSIYLYTNYYGGFSNGNASSNLGFTINFSF